VEINTQSNVLPGSQQVPNNQAVGDSGAISRQELPARGSVMPVVEAKAAPKVEEFKRKDLDKAISDLQDFVDKLGRDLNFRRDSQLDKTVITVRDGNTNQVIRQIPSEEIINSARQINETLQELRSGLLMKDQV